MGKTDNQRPPYEPPEIYDLNIDFAQALGATRCSPTGQSTASGICTNGSGTATGRCTNGPSTGGASCSNGPAPI